MTDKLFGGHYPLLKGALHACALRQEAIAHNIANVNTPGYRRVDVSFEELLRSVQQTPLRATNPRHVVLPPARLPVPQAAPEADAPMRPDGNTVDIDYEMAQLAENQIRFHALSQLITGRYQSLKTVITGGGR
ncbi:MAG: flagellar basal body rod protein FlgB [Armatimonadota bacterium]|nr:flagellar basal body rod protein FlgB [bacterium]MDW8320961.1 flagellar basal body rod protein FlgB [Armatimonadota bacterium]